MSRRPTLPGADELFRATAEPADAPLAALAAVPAYAEPPGPASDPAPGARPRPAGRTRASAADRRPTGRQRHEEKITVYVSPDELVDLERARLALRAEHGMGVDRGRIVREALAVVLADLEAKGEGSILVRRLRGT